MQIEYRTEPNQNIFLIVIGVTILIQIINKYFFSQEYEHHTQRRHYDSIFNSVVFLSSAICYILLSALILYPLLQTELKYYVNNNWSAFGFTAVCLLLFEVSKFLIKAVWYMAYGNSEKFLDNLSQKSFVIFLKYILTLAFIIIFFFTPIKEYYSASYAIIFFLVLYLIDVSFEFLTIEKYYAVNILTKFLYLCTLEILPVLVFIKLIFLY